jgi:phosphotransferase system IIB component
MTTEQILVLSISLAVIVLGITYLYIYHIKTKGIKQVTVSIDTQKLLEALGGKDNILDTYLDHKRLKVHLVNPKLVSQSLLKSLEISGFLTGKELKLLIKDNPIELKNNLDKLRNEVRQ